VPRSLRYFPRNKVRKIPPFNFYSGVWPNQKSVDLSVITRIWKVAFWIGRRYSQAIAKIGRLKPTKCILDGRWLERTKPNLMHFIWGRRANSHFVLDSCQQGSRHTNDIFAVNEMPFRTKLKSKRNQAKMTFLSQRLVATRGGRAVAPSDDKGHQHIQKGKQTLPFRRWRATISYHFFRSLLSQGNVLQNSQRGCPFTRFSSCSHETVRYIAF